MSRILLLTLLHNSIRYRRFFDIIALMCKFINKLQMKLSLIYFRNRMQKLFNCKSCTNCWTFSVMNSDYVMPRPVRRLERLMLYKNIKIFGYAVNGAEGCENYKLHLYVSLGKYVHIEGLKDKYVYELKYKVVQLEARRAV